MVFIKNNIMNKSFSKIKHIQESNLRLEKRFLSETSSQQQMQLLNRENMDLESAGLPPISMDTIEKFDNGEDVSQEEKELSVVEPNADTTQIGPIKEKIKNAICSAPVEKLKEAKKQILSLFKRKNKVEEQVETLTILGVTAAPWVFLLIGGFILILLITTIIKPRRDGWGCTGRSRIMTRVQ